jgi:hypothetical protein
MAPRRLHFLRDLVQGIGQELFGIVKQTAQELAVTAAELTVQAPIASITEPMGAIVDGFGGGSDGPDDSAILDGFLDSYDWDGTQGTSRSVAAANDDWGANVDDPSEDHVDDSFSVYSGGWGNDGGSDSSWGDDSGSDSSWGDDGGSDSSWGDDAGDE